MFPQGEAEGKHSGRGETKSLFPAGPVIKCFVIPLNSKQEKSMKKSFVFLRLAHKFAAVSRSTS